ncbi:MAG TPA: DUF4139 domain-containing protein, partial [Beijerinckiaceae bacterium]|nr:DUF4139 domain-containing protein [Beijerinckiaceae bacterium]
RRAQVTQRTGEDWGDVALAVSTVRVNRGAAAPDLPPLQVSFYEPRPVAQGRPAPMSRSMEARDEVAARAAAPAAPLAKAEEVEATVEAGAFQATTCPDGSRSRRMPRRVSCSPSARLRRTCWSGRRP